MLAGAVGFAAASLLVPARTRHLLVEWLVIVLAGATAWACRRGAGAGGPGRRFFLLFALSTAVHAGWSLLGLALTPWPGARAVLAHPAFQAVQIMGPVLLLAAILSWPTLRSSPALGWREAMDALIFSSSLFMVFWLLGLSQAQASSAIPHRVKLLQLVFALDYTLLMGAALYRALDAPERFRGPLGWLLAGFTLVSAGNLAWIALFLRGAYYPGHPMDALEVVIQTLFLAAALAPAAAGRRGLWEGSSGYLVEPYLPIFVAFPVAMWQLLKDGDPRNRVTLWLGFLMIMAVLGRQLVALADLRRFLNSLEATVRNRTSALEELQATVLRNQRMNLLATLGAGLAHDLNNFLSVVRLTSALLKEEAAEGRPPSEQDLERLQGAADQASHLASNLMAYGRQGETRPQVFDLNAKLGEMTDLLGKLATVSVRLEWDLARQPAFLELDPMHVEQIMVNLVVNARDAMPAGGTLRIASRCQEDSGSVRLDIADTGTGIPPEILDRLFEPFFTTKAEGKGTGLGLASVKAIVEECGGSVAVASEPGRGTTFSVRLPLAARA